MMGKITLLEHILERNKMTGFDDFGLSEKLTRSLTHMSYTNPTPIQAQAIPLALKGRDILGSAQTGTGKTAAFSIPMVEALLRDPHGCALVLTPTRELAKQVLGVVHDLLGPKSNINTAFIIGGEQYSKQMQQLKRQPRIIVGTPGRINDHLERGSLKLNDTGFLVLDETDRMLDMGFGVQLDKIIKFLPENRQTLMFSATLPDGIIKLSSKYLQNPERISVGATNVIAKNIKQDVIRIEQGDKYKELILQLHERQGSVIVFVKTKYNADKMARKLREDGFTADGLHGDLRQNKRDKVMRNFRNDNFRVLVATDIAARGLDVPHIEHVINYDLPQVAEDYIHRMGRTARAGATGSAISFVSNQDGRKWHAITCLLDPEAAAKKKAPPQGRNKSRRKPYRGRPESAKKRASENHVEAGEFFVKKPKKHNKDNRKENRSENRENAENNTQENKADNKFVKKRTARSQAFKKRNNNQGNSPGKTSGKRSGKKPRGFKSDGSSPMKRRNKNNSSQKRTGTNPKRARA